MHLFGFILERALNKLLVALWDDFSLLLHPTFLLAMIMLVPITFASGYSIATILIEPVEKIRKTAEDISTKNLTQRINLRGSADELKSLADTFDNMLGRIDDAYSFQEQFVQDASHELKTPLTIIQTNIDVLRDQKDKTIEDYEAVLSVVDRSTKRLAKLTRDLLFLTREGVELENQRIDLVELLDTVVGDITPVVTLRGLEIKFSKENEDAVFVKGDKNWLEKLFFNILDNAIKYNKPNGRILLCLTKNDESVEIVCEDSGIGMSESETEKLFSRFYRVDKSRSREQGGSGLGLSICKKIVEYHGGDIAIKSSIGHGTTVSISLPRSF
jgi:signal transduction histidine kinase